MILIKKLITTKLWLKSLNIIEIFKVKFLNYTSLHIIITSVTNITVLYGQDLNSGQIEIKGILMTHNETISVMFLSCVLQCPTQVNLYKNKKLDLSATEGYQNCPNTYF